MSRYETAMYTNSSGYDQLTKAYENDAGFDLRASENVVVHEGAVAIIPTGVVLGMPPSMYCRIVGRSSTLLKRGLIVNEGVIDSGFRGELFVIVWNFPKKAIVNPTALEIDSAVMADGKFSIIRAGDALAQVIFHRNTVPGIEYVQRVDLLPESDRGAAGFGSSGSDASTDDELTSDELGW